MSNEAEIGPISFLVVGSTEVLKDSLAMRVNSFIPWNDLIDQAISFEAGRCWTTEPAPAADFSKLTEEQDLGTGNLIPTFLAQWSPGKLDLIFKVT